jgi:hypothetical protein
VQRLGETDNMAFVQMKTAEGYAKLTHDAARLFGIVLTSPTDQVGC